MAVSLLVQRNLLVYRLFIQPYVAYFFQVRPPTTNSHANEPSYTIRGVEETTGRPQWVPFSSGYLVLEYRTVPSCDSPLPRKPPFFFDSGSSSTSRDAPIWDLTALPFLVNYGFEEIHEWYDTRRKIRYFCQNFIASFLLQTYIIFYVLSYFPLVQTGCLE